MEIELEMNKTVDQNAAIYYEKAKKAKKKLKGALETIEKFQKLLEKEKEKNNKKLIEEQKTTTTKVSRKLFWFEKFRWFVTSTGFLVIGGRDATTNEIVIKKHTDKDDLVFHTDMAGSPFFVIKNNSNKKEIDGKTISEVADATCSFSRAWKNGLGTISVFYVKPEQITKEANSGEYLTKGAFMIRGKTNYVENKANLALGIIKQKTNIAETDFSNILMCAPLECIKNICEDNFIQIKEGNMKASDIAKFARKEFNNVSLTVDDVIRILPPGGSDIIKRRKRKDEL
jgi:hypothetical protein